MSFLRNNTCQIGKYLPRFVQDDQELSAALAVDNAEQDRQRLQLHEILDQFFVDSATWGLDDWEAVLAIQHAAGDTPRQRRQRILLKLQSHQTSTKKFLEALAERYTIGTVELQEQNEKNSFRLRCSNVPYDLAGMRDAIETYKPAHLAYIVAHYITAAAGFFAGGCVTQHKKTMLTMAGYHGGDTLQRPVYFAGVVKMYKKTSLKTID